MYENFSCLKFLVIRVKFPKKKTSENNLFGVHENLMIVSYYILKKFQSAGENISVF